MMTDAPFKIAIVGLGPKGLYGFERILAELKASRILRKVEIYLFNRTRFMGSGDVYRSDQPRYLLMNFANKHINMWTEDFPPAVINQPLRLAEYLAKKEQKSQLKIEHLYTSRATVGQYLESGFEELCNHLSENVTIHQLISEVNSIEKNGKRYSISFTQNENSFKLDNFQNILISTGHQRHKVESTTAEIPFIYPVKEKLKCIYSHQTVATKGLGLTFIDAALALTEGKGGSFSETEHGQLIYHPSGKEPKCIYPFSKSGWPMFPKYDFENDQNLYVNSLKKNQNEQLDFEKNILPLLAQDIEFAYYKILFTNEEKNLAFEWDYKKVKLQIENFHHVHSGYTPFLLKNLLEPKFTSEKKAHEQIVEMLVNYTDENEMKIESKAQLGAAAIWRRISPIFNEIYSFNGLDAISQKKFDSYYFGKLNRIAYGPPPENLKKILALANAGIIDFQFAQNPKVTKHNKAYQLQHSSFEVYCGVLINARIPKNKMDQEASGLYRNLCVNNLARPYVNESKTKDYNLNTIEINSKGNLINAQGNPEHISLYGTPTEGIVHDNDTLSRTRNNFASPWAREVIQQLSKSNHEIKHQPPKAYATTK